MARNEKGGAAGGLDRDFGYLMPFFDKVSAVAAGLPAGQRDELNRLLAGEKEKWERIRAVLSGAAPSALSAPSAAGAPGLPEKQPVNGQDLRAPVSAQRAAAPNRVEQQKFTVGSLRGR